MSVDLDEWGEVDVDADPEAAERDDGPAEGELYYDTLDAFVEELLAPTYRRSLGGHDTAWCPQWWRHAEGIARLEAVWRSWEQLRLDPAVGISVWFRDHADYHMGVLLSADGPFKGCSPENGHREGRLESLPIEPPPAGLFD